MPHAQPKSRRGDTRSLQLEIHATAGRHLVPALRTLLPRAHRLAGSRAAHLSVALVGRRRMRRLNKRFLRHDRLTDCLSFALEQDTRGRALSGELIICVPVALARARRLGLPLLSEVLLYAVHGLLHLDGWDDKNKDEFAAMHRREDKILSQMGLGNVFAADATAASSIRARLRGNL